MADPVQVGSKGCEKLL